MGEEHLLQFECAATSDDSTPVKTEWYYGDSRVHKSQRVTISPNGTMTISLPENDTEDNWGNHAGWYTCKATNGYSLDVRQAVINVENFATTLAPSAGGGCSLVLSIFNQFLHIFYQLLPRIWRAFSGSRVKPICPSVAKHPWILIIFTFLTMNCHCSNMDC